MVERQHRVDGETLDFFIEGCRNPVGIFRGPPYPEVPGRFKYKPYRGEGHVALCEALESGRSAQCWYESLGQHVAFEVSREEFILGPPGCFSDWFVEISHVVEAHPA